MRKIIYKLINKVGYRIEKKQRGKNVDVQKLEKFGVVNNFNLLYNSRKFIFNINDRYGDLKITDHGEGLLIQILGIQIFVESAEELLIINEIFVERDYHFGSKSEVVVIDIGANIGIASIYFSLLDCVDKIYAFEPVNKTYTQAKYNFELNNQFTKNIDIQNFGLGGYERKENFIFSSDAKGNVGVRGSLSPSYKEDGDYEVVEVIIKDATKEIENIFSQNIGKKFMMKMDCEGAEYEIFENLYYSGVLNNISIIILEWHDKGAETLEAILIKSGFQYFSRSLGPISGLICAVKK